MTTAIVSGNLVYMDFYSQQKSHSFRQLCPSPHPGLFLFLFFNNLFNYHHQSLTHLKDNPSFSHLTLLNHTPSISILPLDPPPVWLVRREAHLQCPLWQFFSTSQCPAVELGSTTESHLPTVIAR